MRLWLPLAALLTLAYACTPQPAPGGGAAESAGGGGAPPLLASLQATTVGDAVRFVLQVTNTTGSPIELRYPSGQSYDFAVLRDGREVWRWSSGMMFTQALRAETLAPGATLTFEERWTPGTVSGELTVVGRLTSTNQPVEQRTGFRVP